ncbi:hypothetical protein [Natrinema sp. DC36]|uniref:hypothetical protein n=1 Tax=Natrinema sp. DC36 TaxID=2878680 RepID=UPI001CF066D1|nr:hypothetical protein [Natrinema sp. DC36]
MATFWKYTLIAAAFAVWMVGYAIIQKVNSVVIPMTAELDSRGLVTEPLNWLYWAEQYWILIGLIGLLVSAVASGVTNRRGV